MILSHYTTRAGLEGTLRSLELWATNFLQLKDTSEYFYAWSNLNREAMRLVMAALPEGLKKPEFDLEATVTAANDALRNFGKQADPYGLLYVFSFAEGRDDDEHARGILTLWRLYSKPNGYCLQFRDDDVKQVLFVETQIYNYESLQMARVRYGVDTKAEDFKQLAWQLSQYYLRDIITNTGDSRISLQVERWIAESAFFRRLLEFCASHKDPLYKDERELRIFAHPSPRAESRAFTGLARRKPIAVSATGKQYIALGADIRPGFTPFRIMASNTASTDLSGLVDDYEWPPEIVHIDLPDSA
jgi:hypothetical protein